MPPAKKPARNIYRTEQPVITMDINQDPYKSVYENGNSNGSKTAKHVNIDSIVGVDLTRLDLPHMLEVLRGVYERKGRKLNYRPRAYRVHTQAGTITDIQASLYARFQAAHEQVNRLLDLLTPMIPDSDKEDCDAIRELVRDDIEELAEEARWLGGPRKIKFEGTFTKTKDHLRVLSQRYGLAKSEVNTLAEAENWSRFVTIQDIVNDLERSWNDRKDDLDRVGSESFGTQVVWLSRLLGTVKEAITRMRFQLRARLVGEEFMATELIDDQITLTELFQWTADVCDKGVLISTRAGKDGMNALADDLESLKEIYNLLNDPANKKISIPEIYEDDIQQTIQDIVASLELAGERAGNSNRLRSFQIYSITPGAGYNARSITIRIHGEGFGGWDKSKLRILPDTVFTNVAGIEISEQQIQFTTTILHDKNIGPVNDVILEYAGKTEAKLKNGFIVFDPKYA